MSQKMPQKMKANDSLLLVVDVQQKLIPVMWNNEDIITHVEKLLQAANKLNVPHLVSEQYPKGIGHTLEVLMPLVNPQNVMEKMTFSCLGDQGIQDAITTANKKQIIVCGIEAHVCVLQTVLDLIEQKHDVFVVEEAIGSRTEKNKMLAIERFKGAGAIVVSLEMVLFEWLGRAGTDDFKSLLPLIK